MPIIGIAAASVGMAASFQSEMMKVHAEAGASTGEIKRMSRAILNMKDSAFGPTELAKGLYHVESLGYRGAKALHILDASQKLASMSGSDLETTVSAYGAMLLTGAKGTGNWAHAAGTMNAIVGQGNMRLQEFVDAMKSGIVPTALVGKVSIQSLGAALDVVTDRTGSAAVAANRLRTLMMMVAAPTDKAKAALKALHMTSTQLGDDLQKPNGFLVALKDLKGHLDQLPAAQRKHQLQFIAPMFGGSRSTGTMATLLASMKSLGPKYAGILKGAKNFNKNFDDTKTTAMWKFHHAIAQVEQVLTKLGTQIMPIVAKWVLKLANYVEKAYKWYMHLNPAQKELVDKIVVFAAVLGPALMIFGTFVKLLAVPIGIIGKLGKGLLWLATTILPEMSMAFVGGEGVMIGFGAATFAISLPVLAVVAAVVALIAVFVILYKRNHAFHHAVIVMWRAIKQAFWFAVHFIEKYWKGMLIILLGPLGIAIDLIIGYWGDIKKAFWAVVDFIIGHWQDICNVIFPLLFPVMKLVVTHFDTIKSVAKTVFSALSGWLSTAWDWFDKIVSKVQWLIDKLPTIHFPHIPGSGVVGGLLSHLAHGTSYARGGLTVVGEKGPELVNMPRGAQVYTAPQTRSMLGHSAVAGGGGGGGTPVITRLRIANWAEGWAEVEAVMQDVVDQNDKYRGR